jgi:hypothetical protein
MSKNSPRLHRLISVILTVSLCAPIASVMGQTKKKPTQDQIDEAAVIEQRTGNGIFVDNPKVYDDSSLQLMLNSARARLATLQAIDQTGLLSRIGAVTGATLSQSSLGVSITGPPIPQSVVTDNAPTGSTTSNGAGVVQSSTTNLPVQGTVTTNPQQVATAPPAPPNGGLTMPTPSISALDALNEQMQLTYEIANLQLLLEGSLNDRYVKGTRLIKPRTTLGFPVTISSLRPYKDAVAVVEVQVTNPESNFNPDDKPAVTALLPRERTYNVAALTDKMTSIGGGLVTQVINGGFSLMRGRKSYYIVQDQDTLASMQSPDSSASNATAFSWQFRPVLGRSYVRAGMKQTFVQLSAPLRNGSACFGKIKVKTYWRRIDRKTGVLKEVIPESIDHPSVDKIIPVYDLTPFIDARPTYDDLGSGQIRVTVPGKFLAGTFVRVGNNYYRDGSAGFTADLNQIRFVASAADVIKYKAYLVNRDGSETAIVSPISGSSSAKFPTCIDEPSDNAGFALAVRDTAVTVAQGNQANFRVRVTAAPNVNPTVQLSASGVPAPNGGTNWTVPSPAPAAGTVVTSVFTINTTGTPVGNYTVQLQANAGAGYAQQVVNVNLDVLAPVPKPTVQATISSFDDTKSIVKAVVSNKPVGPTIDEYLMVVNDKVFGLADAPLERDNANSTFRAVVPTSVVTGPTKVQVIPLFWGEHYETTPDFKPATLESTVDKVVILDKTADPVVFLLYGSRLSANVITHPGGVTLTALGSNPISEIGTFTLTKAKWADTKQIVLQKNATERPVFVTMPSVDPPPKIVLTVGGRVVAGTDELVVTGDTFDNLTAVTFGKTPINKVISDNKKSVKIVGLVGKGVTSIAGEPELLFEYDAGKKITLKLDVVSSKIETVPRP